MPETQTPSPVMREEFNGAAGYKMELRPFRSASKSVQKAVVATTSASSLIAGAFFVNIGAWPVSLFFALPPLGLALAMHYMGKSEKERQNFTLDEKGLKVEHYLPGKDETYSQAFNAHWLKIEVEGKEGSERIFMRSMGNTFEIGTFLPPPEKEKVADRLRNVIREWTKSGAVHAPAP